MILPNGFSGFTKQLKASDKTCSLNKLAGQLNNYEEDANPQKKNAGNWMKGFRKIFSGKTSSNTEDTESYTSDIMKNVIFNVLTQFIYHFANFGVVLESGNKLILYF